MSHQDWNTITIKNPEKINKNLPKNIVEKKGDMSLQSHLNKIENDTDNFSIKNIPLELSKEIMSARTSKKMTQKDIAIKLNVQQNIYTELENGKAVYNIQTKQLINKIEKLLCIHFQNRSK